MFFSNLEWCIFDILTRSYSDRLCINENANNSKSNSTFFLSTDKIWNGRKSLHTSWSLRPEAQDTIHQPPQDAKKHIEQSISLLQIHTTHTHTQLCPDECSGFILQELGSFVTCDIPPLFLSLSCYDKAASCSSYKHSFDLSTSAGQNSSYKAFLVRARDTRGAGAKSSHEAMDWEMYYTLSKKDSLKSTLNFIHKLIPIKHLCAVGQIGGNSVTDMKFSREMHYMK